MPFTNDFNKKMWAKRTEKDEERKKKGKEAIKGQFFTMFSLVILIFRDGMCKNLKKIGRAHV